MQPTRGLWAPVASWWRDGLLPWALGVWDMAAPVRKPIACVTPLGWTVLVLGLLSWGLAHWLGWAEFAVVAAAALVLFVAAALFTIGRMQALVTLEVTPQRVRVGEASMARFEITNSSSRPLMALGVELPVGVSAARYTTPLLGPGASYEDWVTIPTSHRGVVTVGPLKTERGDPFGLVRRRLVWADATTLYIHPKVAMIDEFGTGLLRDLEGQTTQDVSASDLAFHALRDYIPGDDRRHIHWKSSARLTAMSGEQKFLVRQYLDTRRSHVIIVTDVNEADYQDDDEFELALSCSASVAVRAITDGKDLTVVCGSLKQRRPAPHLALDTYSRASLEKTSLAYDVRCLETDTVSDASLLVLVTGPQVSFTELQMARTLVPMQVRMLVVRVGPGEGIGLRETNGFTEVRLNSLDDLPRALRGGVLA